MLKEICSVNGNSVPFFTALEYERLQIAGVTNSYEGVAVYVFCENENDIDAAKKAVAQNNQPRVIVAIPRNPISVYDAIFTLKALESDWFIKQSQSFSPYEKAEEKKIRDEANKVLTDARTTIFQCKNLLVWNKWR